MCGGGEGGESIHKTLIKSAVDLVVIVFDDVAVVVKPQCQPQDVKVLRPQHLQRAQVFTFPFAEKRKRETQ